LRQERLCSNKNQQAEACSTKPQSFRLGVEPLDRVSNPAWIFPVRIFRAKFNGQQLLRLVGGLPLSLEFRYARLHGFEVSSLDPEELSDRIISIIAGSGGKFCPHLHLPLQSGDDQILAAMRRRYDTAYYRERIERVMQAMPDAAIGTDLIVGFPGETAAHFERYFKFVESLPLAYFHVFPYSVRTGTTAAKLGGRVGQGEIKRQAQALRDLGESKRVAFARRFVGARLGVLLEEREPRGKLSGYSRNYIRVAASGPDELKNREVEVAVSAIDGLGLAGEIISAPEGSASGTAVAIATAAECTL